MANSVQNPLIPPAGALQIPSARWVITGNDGAPGCGGVWCVYPQMATPVSLAHVPSDSPADPAFSESGTGTLTRYFTDTSAGVRGEFSKTPPGSGSTQLKGYILHS